MNSLNSTAAYPACVNVKMAEYRPAPPAELDPDSRERFAAHFKNLLVERFGYKPDPDNQQGFDFLCDYIARYYAGVMKKAAMPSRGLFIYGKPGTGKTSIIKAMCRIFNNNIGFLSVWDLAKVFSSSGAAGLWGEIDNFEYFPLVIDDLGNESQARSFGATLPLVDIIRTRADLFYGRTPPVLTFFTSNIPSRERIIELYSVSVFSRLAGMVDFVEWRGYDHRLKR